VAAVQEWSTVGELDHSQGCRLVDLEIHQEGEVSLNVLAGGQLIFTGRWGKLFKMNFFMRKIFC